MREDFLHYLWKFKKFQATNIKTDSGDNIQILAFGEHNHNAGPDFFNARIKIGDQLWAGNVELHIKSSDWFLHRHETDKAYDNVILHVVWEHDTPVFRRNNTPIPTLVLKNYVNAELLSNFHDLFQSRNTWINCENDFPYIDNFKMSHWMERLYFERLENKAKTILILLDQSKNDWEAVLFKMLCRNFGSKINGDAFFSLANSINFSVIRKTQSNLLELEALFMGQADLLENDSQTAYHQELKRSYHFLKQKFNLNQDQVLPVQFFRLRPLNFPTIRLVQLASLYHQHANLFSKILDLKSKEAFYDLFHVSASEFWDTHYTFDASSRHSKKTTSRAFIDLLLINTIIPMVFCYHQKQGRQGEAFILELAKTIGSESNSIISGYKHLNYKAQSALESQALIQLNTQYCNKNRCLHCAIGNSLLSR